MILRFQKKSQAEWCIFYILIIAMIHPMLIEVIKIPSAIKYTVDIAWVLLLWLISLNRKHGRCKEVNILAFMMSVFFLFTLLCFVVRFQSVLYYFWGLRNNIRFFVFFFACALFLREGQVNHIFELFEKLFWINIPIVLVQYFIMNKSRDYLGGIFGTQKGCNAYANIFLLVVIIRSVLLCMHKKESVQRCLLKCAVAITVAVLSELKVFFIEFAILFGFIFLMNQFSVRKLVIAIGAVLGLAVGLHLITTLFPAFEGWFSIDGIMKIIASDRGYTGQNDLNRLTAVPEVLERYLNGPWETLFGLGLGNCDYATFDILKTPFYQRHASSHYVWFSSSFLVLETGLLGLGLYLSFFIVVYLSAHKREKLRQADVVSCQMSKIMAIMCVLLCFYNVSLRMEAGYMAYFVLALPFIANKNRETIEQHA